MKAKFINSTTIEHDNLILLNGVYRPKSEVISGFYNVIEADKPNTEIFERIEARYSLQNGEILQSWVVVSISIDEIKDSKISEILEYDSSKFINTLSINNTNIWIDKSTRAGLKLRFEAEKNAQKQTTSIWNNGNMITLPIDTAIGMLLELELYASACYDITQQHICNVKILTLIQDVVEYNYKNNYPTPLVYNY